MNKNGVEDEAVLSGTILKIPLVIEDADTTQPIKSTSLWVHVSEADYDPSNNPQFINISLTGIYADGYFHTTLTSDNTRRLFRRNVPNLNVESDANLFGLLENLFPLDLDSLVESRATEGYHRNLKLVAKIIGNRSEYDDKGELLEDSDPEKTPVTISIKTDAKLAITVGTLELPSIEFEDHPYLSEQEDLFNWLDLYHWQNEQILQQLADGKRKVDALQAENQMLQQYSKAAKSDYQKIIKDLEEKFYQALNTKKDKIYELLYGGDKANDKKLTGLNDAFLKNEGKLNEIDKDGISDDFSESSSFGNKRKKSRGGPAAKRRRKSRKIQEQETSEDDVEMKVEPRSTEEESSSNGKSTVVPAMSVEESIHLKEEPGVPKSPELKDDSFIEEVQQEEKPRSFIDDSLAKSSKSQEANKDEDQTDYSDDDTEQDEITTKANETRNEDETDYSDSTEPDEDVTKEDSADQEENTAGGPPEDIDYGSDEIEVVDAPLVKKHTASIELKDSPGESLEIKDSLADTLPVSTSAPKSTKKDGVETDYSDSDESDGSKASPPPKEETSVVDKGLETDYSDDSE